MKIAHWEMGKLHTVACCRNVDCFHITTWDTPRRLSGDTGVNALLVGWTYHLLSVESHQDDKLWQMNTTMEFTKSQHLKKKLTRERLPVTNNWICDFTHIL